MRKYCQNRERIILIFPHHQASLVQHQLGKTSWTYSHSLHPSSMSKILIGWLLLPSIFNQLYQIILQPFLDHFDDHSSETLSCILQSPQWLHEYNTIISWLLKSITHTHTHMIFIFYRLSINSTINFQQIVERIGCSK